ncbi:NADAR family protein [Caenorhabditis elegans]|uniref:Uncharacterized protein n=1 Tax=Caenorhabditis elegans TaxID=6239 RepID=UPI000013B7D5|nr:Uncharacterized protein CELE_F44E2.8 [Caenorhabditis elegans]CCD71232.1 Uncharacterized protein CELE_F44E2.8 [Caenorhabditis elegans]|eukprot:NP_498956.3 Uncharacterized protein CELE_F44E2.8 [Caenorhabditis elegans]
MNKKSVGQPPEGLHETKSLASALPEKNAEQRPKYVQILKQETAGPAQVSPAKSPVGLGNSSPAESPVVEPKKTNAKGKGSKKNNFAQQNGKRPFRVFLKKQEVVALPSEIKSRELPIAPDNVVYFNGPTHYLSALYPCTVVVDGNEYNSVEHYYQACKLYVLTGEQSAAQLKASETPIEVKKATKNILKEAKIPAKKISAWKDKDSIAVLKHVIYHKFNQNDELKVKLLDTGDKILIQTYIGDTYFAAGANAKYTSTWVDRHVNQSLKYPENVVVDNVQYLPLVANGKNVLGWILMQVRDELRMRSSA